METAKKGCWMGCAGLSGLLVALAVLLLLYVLAHREEWKHSSANQTREVLESGIRAHFPEGTSDRAIQNLCDQLEKGALAVRLSNDRLESLGEKLAVLEGTPNPSGAAWADLLETFALAFFPDRLKAGDLDRLREGREKWETDTVTDASATIYLEQLAALIGSSTLESQPPR